MGKILVAEDDPNTAFALREILSNEGHMVEVVHDGQAAVDAHERHAPDLLVLDVAMPKKDGLTACREIRGRDPRVMILIVTALRAQVGGDSSLEAGADDYLAKPFGSREFIARVKALLRRVDRGTPN
jgi:DNA-binding response OmpR family regulator